MKPTLLILAAGMGSRYGKLKQMDAFGPNGETIIEYSIYDAIAAGFGKVVFVIRESFKIEFEDYFRARLGDKIEMEFVCQELDILPSGFQLPETRIKPWGTAHAIWVCKDVINEPFGVINADDYYGVESYRQLHDFLIEPNNKDYSVIGYYLKNTLSDHGTVNRGVCQSDDHGNLVGVKECTKIKRDVDNIIRYPGINEDHVLNDDDLVSMNMWGFLPSYFAYCENSFVNFLDNYIDIENSEFFIPTLIDELIKSGEINVEVIGTDADWFGVTYQEDKPFVMKKIEGLIGSAVYPPSLWH